MELTPKGSGDEHRFSRKPVCCFSWTQFMVGTSMLVHNPSRVRSGEALLVNEFKAHRSLQAQITIDAAKRLEFVCPRS